MQKFPSALPALLAGFVFIAPPLGADDGSRVIYQSLFDSGRDWKQGLGGDPAVWELFPANSRMQIKNTGGANKELRLELGDVAGREVGADIEYGWLNRNRDRAGLGVVLANASGDTGLSVDIRQQGGRETCTVVRFSPEDRSEIGRISYPAGEPDADAPDDYLPGRLKVAWMPGGEAILTLGGQTARQFTGAPFAPEQLIVRDTSRSGNDLVLGSLRVHAGDNPFFDKERIGFPWGATVVEGGAPEWAARLTWPDGRPREVSVQGKVRRDDGREEREVAAAGKLTSGETWTPDLGLAGLSPGLYDFEGTLTVGVVEYPLDHRFAVLSGELASRPHSEIPPWIGIVPQLQRFPDGLLDPICDFMHLVGVRHVRWLPVWSNLEPEPGRYEWEETDSQFEALTARGFEVMGCVSYWGSAGTDIVGKDGQRQARSPEGRAFWVDHYAGEVFKRYGHKVRHWQIWNEPNAYWNEDPAKARGFARGFGTPANYFDLFRRSYDAAKRISPDIKVLSSFASANQMESIEMMAEMGLLERLDGIVVHTYGDHAKSMQRVRQWMDENGQADKGIASGEVGRGGALGSPDGARHQAKHVAEVFLSSAGIHGVFGIDWFVLASSRTPFGFSMVDWRGEPRLSTVAYHTTARLMSGTTGGRSETQGSVRRHVLDREGRPPLTALWVSGNASVLKVGLKRTGGHEPVAWDLMGRRRALQMGDETSWIELGEDPLFIEGDVEVVFPVEMTLAPAEGGGLKIAWNADRPLNENGTLVVETPGLEPERQEREVALDGTQTAVVIPVKGASAGTSYPVRATWQGKETGMSILAERRVGFTQVPQVTSEQAAALRRPAGVPFWEIKDYTGKNPLSGPGDMSAEMALGWTDQYLVLWIEQVDDIWVPVSDHPWKEDGAQFSLDPQYQRSANAFFIEYNFGLRENGSPLAFVLDQPHYNPKLTGKRKGNKTFYRLLVPFGDFGIKPQAGIPMGASLVINENDGDKREGWLHWGGGIAETKNPSLYQEFVLAPPAPDSP